MSEPIDIDALLAELPEPDLDQADSPFPSGNLYSCGDPSCGCVGLPPYPGATS